MVRLRTLTHPGLPPHPTTFPLSPLSSLSSRSPQLTWSMLLAHGIGEFLNPRPPSLRLSPLSFRPLTPLRPPSPLHPTPAAFPDDYGSLTKPLAKEARARARLLPPPAQEQEQERAPEVPLGASMAPWVLQRTISRAALMK